MHIKLVDLSGDNVISESCQRVDKIFNLKSQIVIKPDLKTKIEWLRAVCLFTYLLGIWEEYRDESEVHASLIYELNLHLKPNKYEGLIQDQR